MSKIYSFHAGVGHHFEIYKNVVDSILKKCSQLVDEPHKGFAHGLH
jgi:hypothetical protein